MGRNACISVRPYRWAVGVMQAFYVGYVFILSCSMGNSRGVRLVTLVFIYFV